MKRISRFFVLIILKAGFLFAFASPANAVCWWWQDCTAYQTKYPIVLVHGAGGFDSMFGLDYFFGIPGELEERGATVIVPSLSSLNTPEARGEQLIVQIEDALAITGAEKVNLMGHSQGAQTIRYVAGVRPDLVASITSISGSNGGLEMADTLITTLDPNTPPGSYAFELMDALLDLLFSQGVPSNANDAAAAFTALTTDYAAQFNTQYPDGAPTSECGGGPELVNGIRYYSWQGKRAFTNGYDLTDTLMVLSGQSIEGENDGALSVCSAKWGRDLGSYKMNHVDTINQILGFHHLFEVDPITLYKNQASRLKGLGL